MATLQDYLGITKLRDAWPKWKANIIAINNQVIAHVAGTADKHSAQDITYTGDFVGKTEVKAAIDQAKTEIDTIVISASIDPEVAFARESLVKSKTFETLDARLEEDEQDLVTYKADNASQLTEVTDRTTQSVKMSNALRLYPERITTYDGTVTEVCNGYTLSQWSGAGITADIDNRVDGKKTFEMLTGDYGKTPLLFTKVAGEASPYAMNTLAVALDLSTCDYIDIYIHFKDYDTSTYSVRFYTDAAYYLLQPNSNYINNGVFSDNPYGWRRIRVPKSDATIGDGTPDWTNITKILFSPMYNTVDDSFSTLAKITGVQIPKGVISIDFDDGNSTVYDNAVPAMDVNGLVGTAYVITSLVGTAGYMTWDQLRELRDKGWLIGSHTHTHQDLTSLTVAEIQTEFDVSQKLLRDNGFIEGSYFLATPKGTWNSTVQAEAKKRFLAARYECFPDNTIPPMDNFHYNYSSVGNTNTLSTITDRVDTAISAKVLDHFTFHSIATPADLIQKWTIENFADFCAYVATKRDAGLLDIVTISDTVI